mgnify:CR=1 FL=1
MFLIIVGHYIYWGMKNLSSYGSYDITQLSGGGTYFTMEPLWIISCIGVNCFVMITGYFICDKPRFRWKGILRTWTETAFYILLIGGLTRLYRPDIVSLKDIAIYLFNNGYWFVTCYIGLLAVAPLLSLIVTRLNKRDYLLVLLVLFIMNFQYLYGRTFAGDHSLGWFTFLFMVAGYIRRFPLPNFWMKHKGFTVLLIWGALFILASCYNLIKWKMMHAKFELVSSANDGMMFFLSVAVFVFFAYTKMEGKCAKMIAKIAPYMFGIYLIHMNPFCFKQMWMLIIPDHYTMPIIVHCMLWCIAILIGCAIIDFIRTLLFNFCRIPKFIEWLASKLPNLHINDKLIVYSNDSTEEYRDHP